MFKLFKMYSLKVKDISGLKHKTIFFYQFLQSYFCPLNCKKINKNFCVFNTYNKPNNSTTFLLYGLVLASNLVFKHLLIY